MENWNEKKIELKQKFATLLDNDPNFIESQKEDLIPKLQTKLDKTPEELSKIIDELQ